MKNKKYAIVSPPTEDLKEGYNKLSNFAHDLELQYIERNKKEFDNHKSKIELRLQVIQLIIVNTIFIIGIICSILYVKKLLHLIQNNSSHNVIWILGSFALGITLAVLYICGSTIKSIFGISTKDKRHDVLNTLEIMSKDKSTID